MNGSLPYNSMGSWSSLWWTCPGGWNTICWCVRAAGCCPGYSIVEEAATVPPIEFIGSPPLPLFAGGFDTYIAFLEAGDSIP